MLVKLLSNGERPVTSNANQPIEVKLPYRLLDAFNKVRCNFYAVLHSFYGHEPTG